MIEPITYVKIVRLLRGRGGFDRSTRNAWAVVVVRDRDWFIPVDGNLYAIPFTEPYTFVWDNAVNWARTVASIVGTTSIKCFDGTGPVEIFERELDDVV